MEEKRGLQVLDLFWVTGEGRVLKIIFLVKFHPPTVFSAPTNMFIITFHTAIHVMILRSHQFCESYL